MCRIFLSVAYRCVAIASAGFTRFCSISATRSKPWPIWKSARSARPWATLHWSIERLANEWYISDRRKPRSDNATWPAEKWLLRSVLPTVRCLVRTNWHNPSLTNSKYLAVLLDTSWLTHFDAIFILCRHLLVIVGILKERKDIFRRKSEKRCSENCYILCHLYKLV